MVLETRRTSARLRGNAYTTKSRPRKTASSEQRGDSSQDSTNAYKTRAKRSRTSAASADRAALPIIQLGKLPNMPLDILIEILSWVPPKDVLALSKVSKGFRHLLSPDHPSNLTIWKASRKEFQVPAPMPKCSEYRWAILLFGDPICQVCRNSKVSKVDFALRKRVCSFCFRTHTIASSRFNRSVEFPSFDRALLELVPANIRDGYYTHSKVYWKDDIYRVRDELAKLDDDASSAESFVKERKQFVADVQKYVPACTAWENTALAALVDVRAAKKTERQNEVKDRLLALGYKKVGVDYVLKLIPIGQNHLTDRVWNNMLPRLQKALHQERINRLNRYHQPLLNSRKDIARTIISSYMRTLSAPEWVVLPQPEDILKLSEFRDVLYQEEEVDITTSSFAEAALLLPSLCSDWSTDVRNELNFIMGSSTSERDDLARNVFVCFRRWDYRPTCVSVEGAYRHRCSDPTNGRRQKLVPSRFTRIFNSTIPLAYDSASSELARHLIHLAGLDPDTATVHDMDNVKCFLIQCTRCTYNPPLTWRGFLHHQTYHWNLHTCDPCSLIHVLTSEEMEKHAVHPPDDSPDWTCTHCTAYYDAWATKAAIVDHLRTMHGISDPEVPNDLILRPRMQYPECTIQRLPQ